MGGSLGRSRYPEQNTAAWSQTGCSFFLLKVTYYFPFSPSSIQVSSLVWAQHACRTSCIGETGRALRWVGAGNEERMWQHREPTGLPSSHLTPQPERERLPMINARFPSLAPFRYSIWKEVLSGALQKRKPLLSFAVSLSGKATVKHPPYAQPQRYFANRSSTKERKRTHSSVL